MMIYFGKQPLGRNIRHRRRKIRLSVKKLAAMAGMPCLTLRSIELGILRDIDYDHLRSLCRTLHTTQEELMDKL